MDRGGSNRKTAQAQEQFAAFLKPVVETSTASVDVTVKDFVENTFLPFWRKRWKPITNESRTDSITRHVVGSFGKRSLSSLRRDELQQFLDDRKHLTRSFV